MKNTIKLFGVVALACIISFSFAACTEEEGDGDSVGAILGQETLSIVDQQVYEVDWDENDKISYKAYTGNLELEDHSGLGTALITNGKLSYTQTAAPSGDALSNLLEMVEYQMESATVTPADTKCAVVEGFSTENSPYYRLSRGDFSVSGNEISGTETEEFVMYIYVDKDVTVKADKVGPEKFEEDGMEYTVTQNAVNMSLSKGWNAVIRKGVGTWKGGSVSETISVSKGDTGRWILDEY